MIDIDKQLADLWREWFKEEGNPRADDDMGSWCFFCGSRVYYKDGKSIESHVSWCVFKRAKDLLQGETK